MATQKIIEEAKNWVEKEYDDLRYSKCQRKNFVFTFRELKEMAKQAFIAGHESEDWQYPDKGEYPENKTTSDGQEYNPLVLVFFYRYDDYGKAAKVYALDRWEKEPFNRWQNNRKDKIVAWQYLPGEPGGKK